jgi:hypothetical protein
VAQAVAALMTIASLYARAEGGDPDELVSVGFAEP